MTIYADVTLHADGSGELTIAGKPMPLLEKDLIAARTAAISYLSQAAMMRGEAIHAMARDDQGQWPLVIYPDGTVHDSTTPPLGPYQPASPKPSLATAPPDEPVPVLATSTPTPPEIPAGLVAAEPARPRTRMEMRAQARETFLMNEPVEEPATQGWRGTLTRLGIRTAPSQEERAERADVQAVSQHWPGPRTIAVVNGKGGAGKTPTTVFLSAIFARYGGAGVLAWDHNQTRGTLGWRTEKGPHDATVLDLLPEAERLLGTGAQSADLAHYVHHQTRDRFDVLRSQPLALAHEQRISPSDVDRIHAVAAKFYRVIIMDSGNDESDPMWQRMIEHADQIVVATTTRADHAEAGALLLDALHDRGGHAAQLAENAIAIISQADPRATTQDIQRIVHGYQSVTRDVITIPHDPSIVDGVLHHAALQNATQRAWLHAAAAVARGL
ncbi:MinD/ParA family ATP-binding protein [Devriesea agamarum]|uniref:MinD/ParA family ATP-binding protein n=1 Tax=Devriesea agamarum TaxID=472569 RepID=UPI00071D82BF|nr:AAA family ATPase [Devriesea agamarum]